MTSSELAAACQLSTAPLTPAPIGVAKHNDRFESCALRFRASFQGKPRFN